MNADSIRAQFVKGATVSVCASIIAAPIDYVKDMLFIKKPPLLRNSMHGVGLVMLNDIPAAATAFSINHWGRTYFKKWNGDQPLTQFQKMLIGTVAGACSGVVITPGTIGVLNYRRLKGRASMIKIFQKIYKERGFSGFGTGRSAVVNREMKYAPSYLVLAEIISDYLKNFIINEELCLGVSAALTGAVVGAITTPTDRLRALRQREAMKRKITPYRQHIRALGIKGLFHQFYARSFSISVFCTLMVEGNRHLFNPRL